MEAGRQWRAQDIAIKEKPCAWMPHGFMAVNTKLGAGKAFLRSLHKQYADWGVDFGTFEQFPSIFIAMLLIVLNLFSRLINSFTFCLAVKHDCAFGDDLDEGEIAVVSEVKKSCFW